MTLTDALANAARGRGPRKRPSSGWQSLTPTELEVAGLVAAGLSNPAVAAKLVVSPETVKTHVSHILDKLAARDRIQAVVLAYEAGVTEPGTR